MDNGKISVSLDEVNSTQVDAEVRRQDIAARMAQHQRQVVADTSAAHRMGSGGSGFRRAIVYMSVFALIASLAAWGVGEIVQYKEDHHPWKQCTLAWDAFHENNPNGLDWEWLNYLDILRSKNILDCRANPYFQRSFWEQPKWKLESDIEKAQKSLRRLNNWFYALVGIFVGLGLAIAEPVMGHNGKSAAARGFLGAGLGALGGFVCSLFIDSVYHFLGGGSGDFSVKQLFARGIGWSILGVFLAIAPGIAMRNGKKFLLGLAGGAIGGLVGGFLFDPICHWPGSVVLARCVNILGLGVGAAVATTLLEEAAKQGWLKVATGVITGKQFILYRNPTVIGSSPGAEIYLFKDPSVAPKHAAINGVGGEYLLTALNGATVLVNGSPVRQQRLKNGDQIRVGNTIFLFGARAIKQR